MLQCIDNTNSLETIFPFSWCPLGYLESTGTECQSRSRPGVRSMTDTVSGVGLLLVTPCVSEAVSNLN